MLHALVVDDDRPSLEALAELVESEGFRASRATTLKEARAKIGTGETPQRPDVVLLDLMLPDGNAIEILEGLNGGSPDVVLITGHATVDTAVAALRQGVLDYLTKPIEVSRLRRVLANVAKSCELKEEIRALREDSRRAGRFGTMLGSSPAMQRVYDLIAKASPTEANVLLIGDSGSGKDVAARTIHGLSRRRKGPFLPVNCGAISPTLIESELFGHVRGSFTGAHRSHKGYFERATGGTLFLDEITEMPFELQAKLLRVLETGAMFPVGADREVKVDVRVVAATNRDPARAVERKRLREDLFYRLNVFPIRLPPLCERGDDVLMLAKEFLQRLNERHGAAKRFSDDAIERMRAHRWPGNVRELANVVHRAFIVAEDEIEPDTLPLHVPLAREHCGESVSCRVGDSIGDVERRLLVATLEHFQGDKRKTAEVIGISLRTLYNRLAQYRAENRHRGDSSEDDEEELPLDD